MEHFPAPAPNDAERLQALHAFGVLDTPRERDFDEIAELAAAICGTPIGVINLIGDTRQFFKAEVGLGVRETPFESSFCAKAILEDEFMLIPDATKDVRFNCNPLVTGAPGLRFYAGAVLKTDSGHAIGTVCVLDFVPRELSPLQQQTLRVLANQVMKQLELRKALADRDRAEERQSLLNDEIAHRLKNTLAMVQAIASQTLRGVTERNAVEAFERRLFALSRAHDVLVRENWTAASIHQVIRLVLALHDDDGRITVAGPALELGPKSTLSLSLLLHELSTNAVKYGSTSRPEGRVEIDWRIEGDEEPVFVLTWRESGGPSVSAPDRTGFGSRLIRMGIAGAGGITTEYLPTGLVVTSCTPLALVRT